MNARLSFGDLFVADRKSRIKAGDGRSSGSIPFFTSSAEQSRWVDESDYAADALVFATGGRAAIHHATTPFSTSTDCVVFRSAFPEKINARFAYHYLTANIDLLERGFKGAGLKHVSKKYIQALPIVCPPLEEQCRITAILDKADALRAKRREAIAKLDHLLQSVANNALAEDTLQTAAIGDLLADGHLLLHKDGNHGAQYPRKEDFGDSGVAFLSAKDVRDDGSLDLTRVQRLKESKAKTLRIGWIEKGDVLLAHNATVGKVALYRGEFDRALIGTSLTAFRADPRKIRPEYLFMCMRLPQFQSELVKDMSQTTRNQVPITAQRRLKIPVPKMEIQEKILRAVEIVQRHKSLCVTHAERLDAMMTSLQGAAFTGGI